MDPILLLLRYNLPLSFKATMDYAGVLERIDEPDSGTDYPNLSRSRMKQFLDNDNSPQHKHDGDESELVFTLPEEEHVRGWSPPTTEDDGSISSTHRRKSVSFRERTKCLLYSPSEAPVSLSTFRIL